MSDFYEKQPNFRVGPITFKLVNLSATTSMAFNSREWLRTFGSEESRTIT